jgi:uncharacterized membrane protein
VLVVGLAVVAVGILLPSAQIAAAFAGGSVPAEKLRLGAMLFKAALVMLGVHIALTARLSFASRTEDVSMKEEPWSATALGFILASALLLRLYALNSGLWLDEILTHVNYARLPFTEILSTYASENQHFLFSLLAHLSYNILGEGAFALRLPAAIFGVASIWALYKFGRLVTSAGETVLTSILLSLSYHHIWFSQNARGYTGLLFFAILASYFFIRAQREDRRALWIFYGAASALGIYTHITMVFVVVSHCVIYVWKAVQGRTSARSGLLFGFPFAALLTLQLHALVIPQVFGSMRATKSVVEAWKSPIWTLLELINGVQINFAGAVAGGVAVILFAWGLISYLRSNPIVIQLALIPPILGAAMVVGVGHHLWPRFFFFAFGFVALIFVRGVLEAGKTAGRAAGTEKTGQAVAFTLALLMIVVSAFSITKAYGPKQDYEAARQFVQKQKKPGDVVLVAGLAAFPLNEYYGANWPEVRDRYQLNEWRSSSRRVWVLYTLAPVLQAVAPDLYAAIQEEFRLVKAFPGTLQGGAVFVYTSHLDDPPTRAELLSIQGVDR